MNMYSLLSRMVADCRYFNSTGIERFWAGSKQEEVKEMFYIYEHLDIKPKWLKLKKMKKIIKKMYKGGLEK